MSSSIRRPPRQTGHKTIKRGISDAFDTVWVKHALGGDSLLQFHSYQEGRESFQGTSQHGVLLDEEPPHDIYTECLLRTAQTGMFPGGILLLTFTPLRGLTDVVETFYPRKSTKATTAVKRFITRIAWEDVPHISEEEKADLLARIPLYQRDARTRGVPQLGSGAVYPFPVSEIKIPNISPLPASWVRGFGLDAQPLWKSSVHLALDRETQTWYVYDCYKREEATAADHSAALLKLGKWIPGRGRADLDAACPVCRLPCSLAFCLQVVAAAQHLSLTAAWTRVRRLHVFPARFIMTRLEGVMSQWRSLLVVLFVTAWMVAAPVAVLGQSGESNAIRTPWGDPDLQGMWTSSTYTPLERPEQFADREFLTDEERAELNQFLTADGVDPLRARSVLAADSEDRRRELTQQTQENIHYDNAVWLTEEQPRRLASRRTSLIVDPPNGKIPPLTPETEQREAERRNASRWLVYNISPQSFDSYQTRTLQERCLVWRHEGPPMLPASYNDLLQIFQTEEYVVIMQEMSNNDVRIVPLDGRPHISSNIRQWPGDSRGRWDGETLVVETINFNDKIFFNGASEGLTVVERFTRVDEATIRYEFTVEDPTTWASSWSAEFPLMKRAGPLYEYACHEGNYDIRHILEVARNIDNAPVPNGSK